MGPPAPRNVISRGGLSYHALLESSNGVESRERAVAETLKKLSLSNSPLLLALSLELSQPHPVAGAGPWRRGRRERESASRSLIDFGDS